MYDELVSATQFYCAGALLKRHNLQVFTSGTYARTVSSIPQAWIAELPINRVRSSGHVSR